jgi:hypothetical protein
VECLAGGVAHAGLARFAPLKNLSYQDGLIAAFDQAAIVREVERLAQMTTLGAKVALFRLLVTSSTSAELPVCMERYFDNVLHVHDEASSLYLIRLHGPLTFRYSAIRALLAAQVAPESLRVPPEGFKGFNSAKGILNAAAAGAWPTWLLRCSACPRM